MVLQSDMRSEICNRSKFPYSMLYNLVQKFLLFRFEMKKVSPAACCVFLSLAAKQILLIKLTCALVLASFRLSSGYGSKKSSG